MSTSSDDILNQRRLRAAEIALETARRRRFDSDEAVRTLQAEIADVEAALDAVMAARERDRTQAESQIEAARRTQRAAEQAFVEEHSRRLELEQQLADTAREESARDHLARQLAAEVRIRELEAELELVFRRAAEFEYGVRMAAFDAFKLVRDLVDRVGSVLPHVKLGLPELGRGDPEGATTAGVDAAAVAEPAPETSEHGYDAVHPGSTGLDSERLDAALERLRASTPPPAESE